MAAPMFSTLLHKTNVCIRDLQRGYYRSNNGMAAAVTGIQQWWGHYEWQLCSDICNH